ncbi:MAG TPA: efflux RND transporter periplasmic adaptor subunit [Sedimenticola thiotaurini]|uniref:Efflux RND transporter periplasmic adaptor subunit n=1 Tax=Sedimenticola thiotaurini TaxID=1543721 RepID=A0A831RHP1_9GAMM|nr:efflux RND transporter periplasmic adaptor subunit [Sedimenticola thiotaurini]
MSTRPGLRPLLIPLLPILLLAGCSRPPPAAPDNGTPRRQPSHLVETVTIAPREVSTSQERTGTLRARRRVRIHNQEEGEITKMPFYEGEPVAAGQLLVQINDDLLSAELDKAKANTRLARVNLRRVQDLLKRKAASKDELARARNALDVALAEQRLLETRLGHTRITAPFDGVIAERKAEPGDVASKYSHLLTLTDPRSLVIEIDLSELLLPRVKPGDPVQVRIDALGRRSFPGHIRRIHPELDPVTRQGTVEIALDPVPAGARAGQFARVTLETTRAPRLLVPFEAVRRDRGGEYVYRLDRDDRVRRTPVRSGLRIGSGIEILDGLEPGDRVVSRGFLGLSDGNRVEPVDRPPPDTARSGDDGDGTPAGAPKNG